MDQPPVERSLSSARCYHAPEPCDCPKAPRRRTATRTEERRAAVRGIEEHPGAESIASRARRLGVVSSCRAITAGLRGGGQAPALPDGRNRGNGPTHDK